MPNTMRLVSLVTTPLVGVALAATMVGAQAATTTGGSMLIKNATVLTVTKGTLQNADILVRNGKIAQVGQNLTAPNGALVIDATGKFVMPGIIDPHSHAM